MKYYKFMNEEQAMSSRLLADIFGSILGLDLHTSVVNPLLKKISKNNTPCAFKKMRAVLNINSFAVLVIDQDTAHIS